MLIAFSKIFELAISDQKHIHMHSTTGMEIIEHFFFTVATLLGALCMQSVTDFTQRIMAGKILRSTPQVERNFEQPVNREPVEEDFVRGNFSSFFLIF